MITITEDLLLMGMQKDVGINSDQAMLLGVDHPLKAGWKDRLIGAEVHEKTYGAFLLIKGMKPAPRKKVIKKYLGGFKQQ